MKRLFILVKIAITFALVFILISGQNFEGLFELPDSYTLLTAIGLSVVLLLFQSFFAALRQRSVLSMFGRNITWAQSFKIWFSGLFASQLLITFIAGDFIRGIKVARLVGQRRLAARAIVLDRVLGSLSLLILTILAVPFVLPLVADSKGRVMLILLGLGCIFVIVMFFGLLAVERLLARHNWKMLDNQLVEVVLDLASISKFTLSAPWKSVGVLIVSGVMHLLNVAAIVLIANLFGVEKSIWLMSVILVPVTLMMILPISLAGWGVREAAAVSGLSLLGVPAETSLIVSVTFGFSMLIISTIGIFYFPWGINLRSDARQ